MLSRRETMETGLLAEEQLLGGKVPLLYGYHHFFTHPCQIIPWSTAGATWKRVWHKIISLSLGPVHRV